MTPEPAEKHFAGCGRAAVQVDLKADLREIGPVVDEVVRAANTIAGPADAAVADELRLALTEALNNVVEHAAHPSELPIVVTVGGHSSTAWICIQDRGVPLPEWVLTRTETPVVPDVQSTSDLDLLPDGGWGWMLIKASVDRVSHRRVDGCNLLLLERQLTRNPAKQTA
ncbi:MAG: ATP-binding protein [Pseudomonadota bacterium]